MRSSTLCLLLFSAACAAFAQGTDTDTRTQQIEAERAAKQASIPAVAQGSASPDKKSSLGSLGSAFRIWNFAEEGSHGLALRLGGLAYDSGFALGPDYVYKRGDLYDPGLIWDSFAVASLRGFYKVQSQVELPKLLDDHAFFDVKGYRYDYPRLEFYGPGTTSAQSGRSDYRMQDNAVEIRSGLRLGRRVEVGALGSYQRIRIMSGTDHDVAQTDLLYSPQQTPGIGLETSFLTGGFYAQYDGRDEALDPHAGTLLRAQFENVHGSRGAFGGFNQYDFQAHQYIPIWNKRRVIALRAQATLTAPHSGTDVPFYLEPRLGGPDDLRGFRAYRFYDRNAALATAEYRFTVVESLEMALFADAGKVYRNWDSFSIAHTQADVGFGLRAHAGSTVPFRVDFGFSREGVQVWLNFFNVF